MAAPENQPDGDVALAPQCHTTSKPIRRQINHTFTLQFLEKCIVTTSKRKQLAWQKSNVYRQFHVLLRSIQTC